MKSRNNGDDKTVVPIRSATKHAEQMLAVRAKRKEQRRAEIAKLYAERELGLGRLAWLKTRKITQREWYGMLGHADFRAAIDLADEMRRTWALDSAHRHVSDICSIVVSRALTGDLAAAELVLRAERMLLPPREYERILERTAIAIVDRNRADDRAPVTVEAAFEVIDERVARIQRFKKLARVEEDGQIEDDEPS